MTSDNFAAKIKQANLADKNDIADFVKKTDFDDMISIVFVMEQNIFLQIDYKII